MCNGMSYIGILIINTTQMILKIDTALKSKVKAFHFLYGCHSILNNRWLIDETNAGFWLQIVFIDQLQKVFWGISKSA